MSESAPIGNGLSFATLPSELPGMDDLTDPGAVACEHFPHVAPAGSVTTLATNAVLQKRRIPDRLWSPCPVEDSWRDTADISWSAPA